ncbi:hypothetical protein [Variovorax sp. YR216]|uniref:hypothetical protein n=1 Tax=Variovorax sp. YR216 TaxID=1882828 RepID=UPI00089CD72B|nr:hypothetical protein [Variovorax sp. YR216]SEB26309.1 hypothetical protein SAMN05444680_13112 [Variovorax sp. YR216]
MANALNKVLSEIEDLLDSPTASHWFKHALKSAMGRDIVDAARDAELLARLMVQRCEAVQETLLPGAVT